MASCKFEGGKCHGAGDVKAALRHNDTTPEMRAVAAKGNPDIDVSKAGLNVRLWGGTYAERCAAYDARIAELDARPGANVRKDRVTGQLIETPVPKDLPRGQYNAWAKRVLEIQVARYGAENIISADVHWDEEHEYTGEGGKAEMSRVHLQTVAVPVVDGRLCGKEFFSRRGMRELNAEVQAMSREEFGVDFMDGTKKKGQKSTEQLKAESAQRAQEAAQRLQEARQAAAEAPQAAQTLKTAQRAAQRLLEAAKRIIDVSLEAAQGLQKAVQEAKALPDRDTYLLDRLKQQKGPDGRSAYDRGCERYDAERQRREAKVAKAAQAARDKRAFIQQIGQEQPGQYVDDSPDYEN